MTPPYTVACILYNFSYIRYTKWQVATNLHRGNNVMSTSVEYAYHARPRGSSQPVPDRWSRGELCRASGANVDNVTIRAMMTTRPMMMVVCCHELRPTGAGHCDVSGDDVANQEWGSRPQVHTEAQGTFEVQVKNIVQKWQLYLDSGVPATKSAMTSQ